MSNVSSPPGEKQVFHHISSRAWEHPADRTALVALQKIPGVDLLLQKFIGATSEKSFRLIYLASAVQVTSRQLPHLHTMLQEACRILDAPTVPELYVAQSPFFSAGAIGVQQPFMVLNSALLDMLNEAEILALIGHELGHCLSGHALYKTLLQVLLKLSVVAAQIPLGGAALLGIVVALMEWNRKSELSADRAGLLVAQEPQVVYSLLTKMAGGSQSASLDIAAFLAQAAEYDSAGGLLDSMHKILNLLFVSHPFPVIRLTELKSWVDSGAYGRILAGQYVTRDAARGSEQQAIFGHIKAASAAYKDQLDQSRDTVSTILSDVLKNLDTWTQQAKSGVESWFDPTSPPSTTTEQPTARQEAVPPEPETPAERPGGESDPETIFQMLEKLRELQDKGVITEQDFATQKARLLSRL